MDRSLTQMVALDDMRGIEPWQEEKKKKALQALYGIIDQQIHHAEDESKP